MIELVPVLQALDFQLGENILTFVFQIMPNFDGRFSYNSFQTLRVCVPRERDGAKSHFAEALFTVLSR